MHLILNKTLIIYNQSQSLHMRYILNNKIKQSGISNIYEKKRNTRKGFKAKSLEIKFNLNSQMYCHLK